MNPKNKPIITAPLLRKLRYKKPQPDSAIVPVASASISKNGRPELTCLLAGYEFDGYTVWLTRPRQDRMLIAFPDTREYVVEEPLPGSGFAEVWIFEVQYRYQNKPFGQMSQPLKLTVMG